MAVAQSRSYAATLRNLGMCTTGGNARTLRRWIELWSIGTEHFDADAARTASLGRPAKPLHEVLVENSTFSRGHLKLRLLAAGVKQPRCELCDQGELWQGRRMSLILDHINGVANDHRIENLRIVCPNCAATLETHCGRKNRIAPREQRCERCAQPFVAVAPGRRYCSRHCGQRWDRSGRAQPALRRVERPPEEQLAAEVSRLGYSAVGWLYGVSDNAIRKWLRQYEHERLASSVIS